MDSTLPAFRSKNIVTWNCHVHDSVKGRYDMILGSNIFRALGLNIKFSEHIIKADDGPLFVTIYRS